MGCRLERCRFVMASKLIEEFANELLASSTGHDGLTVMTPKQAWAIAGEAVDQEKGRPYIEDLKGRHLNRVDSSAIIKELKGSGK
jgi:hypothetical protein